MLVVTHEMGFAAHVADRVAFIDEGELVGVDSPDRILRQPAAPVSTRSCAPIENATVSERRRGRRLPLAAIGKR